MSIMRSSIQLQVHNVNKIYKLDTPKHNTTPHQYVEIRFDTSNLKECGVGFLSVKNLLLHILVYIKSKKR